jgi:hypothetical protein
MPEGVDFSGTLSLAEFRARPGIESDSSMAAPRWILDSVRSLKAASSEAGGSAVLLERRQPNPVHARRGFWAIHDHEFPFGARRLEEASFVGRSLYLAGVLDLSSEQEVSDELMRQRPGIHSLVLIGGSEEASLAALHALLQSPHLARPEFFVRYLLPEMIAAVVDRGSLVLRMWREDEAVLEAFARPGVLRRAPGQGPSK